MIVGNLSDNEVVRLVKESVSLFPCLAGLFVVGAVIHETLLSHPEQEQVYASGT